MKRQTLYTVLTVAVIALVLASTAGLFGEVGVQVGRVAVGGMLIALVFWLGERAIRYFRSSRA